MPAIIKQNKVDPVAECESFQSMLERAYERHPTSTKDAARALEEMVLLSEDVFFELMKPHVYRICYDALSAGMKNARRVVWVGDAKNNTPTAKVILGGPERVTALAASNLMLFPLRSGLKLADACRADVIETADHYAKISFDAAHKSRWLTLIAQGLGDGEKVSEKFTEARLAELKKEAEHAA